MFFKTSWFFQILQILLKIVFLNFLIIILLNTSTNFVEVSAYRCTVHASGSLHASYGYIFWKCTSVWMGLRTHAVLLLQLHVANQILSVFARTQREYRAQFWRVFTFKFVFANCSPDFNVKKYVCPMFVSNMVLLMFTENYYTPRSVCTAWLCPICNLWRYCDDRKV